MKKIILAILFSIFTFTSYAQTNIQEMYDFDRNQLTTTLEHFNTDDWGSNFFFVDIAHKFDQPVPGEFYTEISRSFNFWKDTKLSPLSLHVEYNGGIGMVKLDNNNYTCYGINNSILAGVEYFIHSKDFKKTLTLEVLYKKIFKANQQFPLQFTTVFGINDLFNIKGLNFSGFADFWFEDNPTINTRNIFLSEPQLWYNIYKNLNIGGEVELSNNFASEKGFHAKPCLGIKWNF